MGRIDVEKSNAQRVEALPGRDGPHGVGEEHQARSEHAVASVGFFLGASMRTDPLMR